MSDDRRRQAKRARRARRLARARVKALGCTCDARAELVLLPIGPAVRVEHERGCSRWEAIRTDGRDVLTGRLYPADGEAA